MPYPADDKEFTEYTIEKVTEEGHGSYVIVCDGWHLSCGKDCAIKPQVGQIARQYGRGIGSPVRGLFIGGKRIWYRSPTEDAEHHEIQSYGADAEDWLGRWDQGRSVWSIEMGGIGPAYEQCIQITVAEMLRWFIRKECDASLWSDPEKWKCDRDAIDEDLLDTPGKVRGLGLSGAQWGAALSLASCIYRDGPRVVMNDQRAKDRRILVSKDFPGSVAA